MKDQSRLLYSIAGMVTLFHIGAFEWMHFSETREQVKPQVVKCVVNTVSLKKSAPAQEPPKKISSPQKPVVKNESPKKNPPKKVESESKKQLPQVKNPELLAMVREKIKKMNETKLSTECSEVNADDDIGMIESLKIDHIETLSSQDRDYCSVIAASLRRSLRLPEIGDVQIQLKLGRAGKVIHFEVIHSESQENQQYVESIVPKISFPAFGKNFQNEQDHTFTITLTNEV